MPLPRVHASGTCRSALRPHANRSLVLWNAILPGSRKHLRFSSPSLAPNLASPVPPPSLQTRLELTARLLFSAAEPSLAEAADIVAHETRREAAAAASDSSHSDEEGRTNIYIYTHINYDRKTVHGFELGSPVYFCWPLKAKERGECFQVAFFLLPSV